MRRLLEASPGMRRAIRQCVSEEVRKEVSRVCNQDHKLAEYATLDTLEKFSWMNIISDMRERTPFLFSLLFATQHKGKTILTDAYVYLTFYIIFFVILVLLDSLILYYLQIHEHR